MEEIEANSLNDFVRRFDALMDEAKGYGVRSVVILYEDDPLSKQCERYVRYNTGLNLAVGLCESAKHSLLKTILDSSRHEQE